MADLLSDSCPRGPRHAPDLVDGWVLEKSAAARAADPRPGPKLAELAGSLFVCQVGELEQLYSARSALDYDRLKSDLHSSFDIVAALLTSSTGL
jgi:hypothetical protein